MQDSTPPHALTKQGPIAISQLKLNEFKTIPELFLIIGMTDFFQFELFVLLIRYSGFLINHILTIVSE